MKNEIKSFGYKPENIKNDEFTIYKTKTEKYKAGELVKAIQKSNKKAKKKKNKKKTTLSTDKNDT